MISASIDCVEGVIYGDHGKKLAHWETDGTQWWFVKHTSPFDTLEHIRRDGVRLYYVVSLDDAEGLREAAEELYAQFKGGTHDAQT